MKFPLTLPCIRIHQPIGDFFVCSIPAAVLKQVAYWVPASAETTTSGLLTIFGVQRRLSPVRARQIGRYIDENESTFPSSIIISANYDEADNYIDDEAERWHVNEKMDGCFELTIPTSKRLASVIDGQHRLAGFEFAEKADRQNMQLPCAVFLDLPRAYQANIFATINFNQKKVDKSLAYQLFGYELDEKNKQKWPPAMVALFVARVLNAESSSPFREHIKLAVLDLQETSSNHNDVEWEVSIATVVEGILRLISSRPADDKSLLLSGEASVRRDLPADEKAPLRSSYIGAKDREIYEVVAGYFRAYLDRLWKPKSLGGFAVRTVGIQAAFDILRIALERSAMRPNESYQTARSLFERVPNIDFHDNYFHASGAARVRIRNVLGVALGLIGENELRSEEARAGVRRILSASPKR